MVFQQILCQGEVTDVKVIIMVSCGVVMVHSCNGWMILSGLLSPANKLHSK